jgi:hypothetical protein
MLFGRSGLRAIRHDSGRVNVVGNGIRLIVVIGSSHHIGASRREHISHAARQSKNELNRLS